jgi:hypothetical protein
METLGYGTVAIVAAALGYVVAPEIVGLAVLGLGLLLVLGGPVWAGAAAVLFVGMGILELVTGEMARDASPIHRRAWTAAAKGLGAVEAALAASAVVTIANVL